MKSFHHVLNTNRRPLSQCCALPALTERSLLSLRDISPFHGESPLSGEPYLLYLYYYVKQEEPLKTFHRNVSKIRAQQTGHRAERSCSLRPRKAVAFLTHLLRAPEHGAGNFAVCGQRLRGHVPSKNTSPAALSWSSLTSPTAPVLFVPARCFLYSVGTRRAVSVNFARQKDEEYRPPLKGVTPHGVGRCPKGRGDRSVRGGPPTGSGGVLVKSFHDASMHL